MTERINPNTGADQGAPTESTDSANVEHVTDSALLLATDGAPENVTPIVRHWSSARRVDAIVAMVGAVHPNLATLLDSVKNAPSGIDPVETLADRIGAMLDNVAALIVGAREHVVGFTFSDDQIVESFGAALTRVEPATGETVAAAMAPERRTSSEKRTRQSNGRNWLNNGAAATYSTPGRAALDIPSGRIVVTVTRDGVPTFKCSDGTKFGSPSAALRHEDRFDVAATAGNNGSPFEVCRAVTGARKGDRMHEITLADSVD